jgi:hypothetical protein
MGLKPRRKPLTKRQERILRLRDEKGLHFDEIARRLGTDNAWAREIYKEARKRSLDFKRRGEDSLLLLPKRARQVVQFCHIKTRAEFRTAVESGQLVQFGKTAALRHQKHGVCSCGPKTWALLTRWAGRPAPTRRTK